MCPDQKSIEKKICDVCGREAIGMQILGCCESAILSGFQRIRMRSDCRSSFTLAAAPNAAATPHTAFFHSGPGQLSR